MRRLLFMFWAWLCFGKVQSKAVFAHFMVGNVAYYTAGDWLVDIEDAWALGIDAFALNIAYGDDTVSASVATAFEAIQSASPDFKLFFSFDYAGGGPWPAADVASYLAEYTGNTGYYHTDSGKAFVSTFEGPANAQDWVALKSDYNIFFMPDWSSLGAGPAWDLGVADGLFSWAAWPWGDEDSNTYVDASYLQVLKDGGDTGAPYMMGVSPMFYTNLPHYDKNWAWRGDRLWFDRWKEVLFLQPDYVEIITWNDWGESHYIRAMDQTQAQSVLSLGEAPFDFVTDFDHSGWTKLLPFFTSLYKTGSADNNFQTLVAWGRSTSVEIGCSTNGTTVNTASQLQIEFQPDVALRDNVYFVAVVKEMPPYSPFVTVGGEPLGPDISDDGGSVDWSDVIGSASSGGFILFGNASFSGYTGDLTISLSLADNTDLTVTGSISDSCTGGFTNYNMWTAYDMETLFGPLSVEDYVCTAGTSVDDFSELCEFTCALGYCPYTACICSEIGPQPDLPEPVATQCYPLASASVVYDGLCHFACTYGFLDTEHCGTDDVAAPTPTVSPFTPHAATAGTGNGENAAFDDLCEFTCQYGYCPLAACTVTATGPLVLFTGEVYGGSANFTSEPWSKPLDDLCTFSCNRGNCPDACMSNLACTSGSGDDNYAGLCSFSCGYGFCPEPCTCLSHGIPDPPTYDPTIVGYADAGLDADTYGPLCNFTCSHGYCPAPNACLSSITIDPDEESTIPTLPAFDSTPGNVTYSPGDFFTYVSEENTDLSLDVILLESADLGTISCDDVVSDDDGATLGCVGEAVAFLMLSILNDNYAISAKRDIGPNTNYDFETHSHWEASGNCTTIYCMLADGVPLHTWTSVGNGSYNSAPYELHFINTGKTHGYSATRGLPSNRTMITNTERRASTSGLRAQFLYRNPQYFKSLVNMDKYEFGNFDQPLIDLTTYAAMDSAKKGYTITCNAWKDNNTAIVDNSNSIMEGVMDISFPTVATDVGVSTADADNYVSSCTTKEETAHTFVIWPYNGLNVDSLSALLASFPNANVVPHVSLNGWGILAWTADLTPSQWKQVTQNKECWEADASCTDDCEDPTDYDLPSSNDVDQIYAPNTTASFTKDTDNLTLSKRDGGYTAQYQAQPDLWYISQPPGSGATDGLGTYVYDSTGGRNVVVYILDLGAFRMSLPELSPFSAVIPQVIGPEGWAPAFNDVLGIPDHGTAMLAAMAGVTVGVAKSITPVPISFSNASNGLYSILALDWIYRDWISRAATLDPSLAPLAVLSMSWGFYFPQPEAFEDNMAVMLRRLVDSGILPMTSAGNTGQPVGKLPSSLADSSRASYVPSMLVVGAVDNSGAVLGISSPAPWIKLYGPGYDVRTPYWDFAGNKQDFKAGDGTSAATAKAAGLAAYFIGLSTKTNLYTNVQALAADILVTAWSRVNAPNWPSLYNGVPATDF